MKIYKPRRTRLNKILAVNDWTVKVYTITTQKQFNSEITLDGAIRKLPEWLEKAQNQGFEIYKVAFLIVHEGLDGVWNLISWWTEGEILQSLTFFAAFDSPREFQAVLKEGFMACVWEMEVILFERDMWIEHVLKKADKPDFETYLHKSLNNYSQFLE